MKTLVKLLIVVLLLLVVAVAVGFYSLDSLAARAIEYGGRQALGVETSVDNTHVRLLKGEFVLTGLQVDNPQGFDAPHFMRLGSGSTAIDLGTLRAEKVVLPHLTLGQLDMHLQRAGGQANYAVIMDNLKQFEQGRGSDSSAEGKRYVIEKLQVHDITVHADLLPAGGEATRLEVPIQNITLENVGSDTDRGVLMGGLMDILIQAVLAAVIERGGLPADLVADLNGRLQNLTGAGNELLGQVRGQIEGVGDVANELGEQLEGIGDRAGDILEGLGNLGKPKNDG